MVAALVEKKIIQPSQKEAATKALSDQWKDTIAITWTISDVQEMRNVSDDDARAILQDCLHDHDASIGMNWDFISSRAEDYPVLPDEDDEEKN
jgi:hypothetical protein